MLSLSHKVLHVEFKIDNTQNQIVIAPQLEEVLRNYLISKGFHLMNVIIHEHDECIMAYYRHSMVIKYAMRSMKYSEIIIDIVYHVKNETRITRFLTKIAKLINQVISTNAADNKLSKNRYISYTISISSYARHESKIDSFIGLNYHQDKYQITNLFVPNSNQYIKVHSISRKTSKLNPKSFEKTLLNSMKINSENQNNSYLIINEMVN